MATPIEQITADTERMMDMAEERIEKVFPESMKGQWSRFYKIAHDIVMHDPNLSECSASSKVIAVHHCAKLGLIPDPALGHIFIIPRWNSRSRRVEACPQIGYRGIIELALRSKEVSSVRAIAVYKNDFFEYEDGLDVILRHKPYWLCGHDEPGKIIAGFAVATRTDGVKIHKVIDKDDIQRARDKSASATSENGAKFSPWNTAEAPMVAKTAVNRLEPFLPQSPELQYAVGVEHAIEADKGIEIPPELLDVVAKTAGADVPEFAAPSYICRKGSECGLLQVEIDQVCDELLGTTFDKVPHDRLGELIAKFEQINEETIENDRATANAANAAEPAGAAGQTDIAL